MNDSVKFPNTLDASVWASRCTAWFSAFKVPDLAEWFAAALQRGYLQGVGEAEQKQGDREAAMRRFLALAPATREKFLEVAMAETPARTMTASQYLACQQMNAAPPSTQAPEPPGVEERLGKLETNPELLRTAVCTADREAEALADRRDKRLSDLEARQ